jgi:cellulose synthase/poly-beta-1,6-N-acetylglucosamine synthase-like glycosyltransferase
MTLSLLLLLIGVLGAAYPLGGYRLALGALVAARRRAGARLHPTSWPAPDDAAAPGLTVLIPAFDEEEIIAARVENLLACDYPPDKLEVVVVSDGSTDGTVDAVRRVAAARPDRTVRVHAFHENRGKHAVQNWTAEHAAHEVLVFSDAETRFEPGTLRALAAPLADPSVAVVGGRVAYAARSGESGFGRMYRLYRGMEDALRRDETRLGVGCKTDGSCTAARRAIWRELAPFEAEDQTLPLLARLAGLRTVNAPDAVAHDAENARARQEFEQRRRMTRKAVMAFLHRWSWRAAARHPAFTAAYVSHKLLRFALPLFLLLALAGGLGAAAAAGALIPLLLALLAGLAASPLLARLPGVGRIAGLPYAFLVANAAMAAGVVDGLTGRAPSAYVPTRRL